MATSPCSFERPPILRISQEVIDEIVDETRLADLLSLSLASRAFRPRSEKHIFASVVFFQVGSGWSKTARVKGFIEILSRKPYIAGYVRELHLGINERNQEWMVENPGFIKIMELIRESASRFPHKKLELIGNTLGMKITDSRRFSKSFCAPFLIPFLSSLCLDALEDVPLTLVTDCPHLKIFDLARTTFGALDLVKIMNTSQSYPQLRELRFDQCTQGMDTLLRRGVPGLPPIVNLSKLRKLETNICWLENMGFLRDLLYLSSGSLEELRLKLDYSDIFEFHDLSEWLDLGTLFHLHVLHVDILFTGAVDELPHYTPGLISVSKLLTTIPSANTLEGLTIKIFLGNFWARPMEVGRGNWASLDHEVQRLSSGKPLDFHLHLVHDTSEWNGDYPESEHTDDDDSEEEEEQDSNSYKNGHPITAHDIKRALDERTFRKLVDKKLPMIRCDPNIMLHLIIDPYHRPGSDAPLTILERFGSFGSYDTG